MENLKKRWWIVVLCLVLVAAVAVVIAVAAGNGRTRKKKDGDACTVRFELCTELQTTTVLERTVRRGELLEEPEVYVTENNPENWSISGWYTESDYQTLWDFDFDIVEGDLTLYAKWKSSPECVVSFYTAESEQPVYVTRVQKGLTTTRCDEVFVGREVLGYYTDKDMTQEFNFDTELLEDLSVYVKISDYVYFNAKSISRWSLCGDESEVSAYDVSTALSPDETSVTVTSKNGGYLWLKNLDLKLNGTSVFELKVKEQNGNYTGTIGGYILGSYSLSGVAGASDNFGQAQTGPLLFTRSSEPDEDGYYTYSYSLGDLTPGLVYDTMTGIRLDIWGDAKYQYEIKEIRTKVGIDIPVEAFISDRLDLKPDYLQAFTKLGDAVTMLTENGDFRLRGGNGAAIYKKNLNINLGAAQIIQIKAKGDLKGGNLGLYLYGDYTQNGKDGSKTDYDGEHSWIFVPGDTDANGYTTYTADIGSIAGLKYQTIKGMRIELWGTENMSLDIRSVKGVVPSDEEKAVNEAFTADKLNLGPDQLKTFLIMGEASTELTADGDLRFSGKNGSFIYKKNMQVNVADTQIIRIKAKGDLKGGNLGLYLYGDYTQNGKAGSKTDYDGEHSWTFVPGDTDAEGYRTYTVNIGSVPGLVYQTIKGMRIELWGAGNMSLDIRSVKGVAKEDGEVVTGDITVDYYVEGQKIYSAMAEKGAATARPEDSKVSMGHEVLGYYTDEAFTKKFDFSTALWSDTNIYVKLSDYLYFSSEMLMTFDTIGAEIQQAENGTFVMSGEHGAFIYKKNLNLDVTDTQILVLKAKGTNVGGVALYLYGDYSQNGQNGSSTDYNGEHVWVMHAEETDEDGYTTYTVNLGSISGLAYQTIKGFRIEMWNGAAMSLEIQSVQAVSAQYSPVHYYVNGVNVCTAYVENGAKAEKPTEEQLGLIGRQAVGYYWDTAFTREFNFAEVIHGETNIYIKLSDYLYLSPAMLSDFEPLGEAAIQLTENGTLLMSGVNGSFIHKKGLEIGVADTQLIEIRAKGDLKGGAIGVYLFGDYTQNGTAKSTGDYNGEHCWAMSVGETDAEGYTSYTLNIGSVKGLAYQTIRGLRIELWGGSAMSFEIQKIQSSAGPEKESMNISPEMLSDFEPLGGATIQLTGNGTLLMSGVNGSFIHKKGLEIDVADTQMIEIRAKGDLKGGAIGVYLFGDYTQDGTAKSTEDYNGEHCWAMSAGETDAEGYTSYTLNIGSIKGLAYQTIRGLRIELWGGSAMSLEIQSVRAVPAE